MGGEEWAPGLPFLCYFLQYVGGGGLYQYAIKMMDRPFLPSLQVRIFPYLIGRESAFAENLKWMACANKGGDPTHARTPCNVLFFFRITTMFAVLPKTQSFQKICSKICSQFKVLKSVAVNADLQL